MIGFKNDSIAILVEVVQEIYPHIDCVVVYDDRLPCRGEKREYGMTYFEDGKRPLVVINGKIPYYRTIEVLAHELAHVVTPDDKDHGAEWEEAFGNIYAAYCERLASFEKEILEQRGK